MEHMRCAVFAESRRLFLRSALCLLNLQTWLPKFAKSNMANVRMNSIGSRRWQQKPHEIEK